MVSSEISSHPPPGVALLVSLPRHNAISLSFRDESSDVRRRPRRHPSASEPRLQVLLDHRRRSSHGGSRRDPYSSAASRISNSRGAPFVKRRRDALDALTIRVLLSARRQANVRALKNPVASSLGPLADRLFSPASRHSSLWTRATDSIGRADRRDDRRDAISVRVRGPRFKPGIIASNGTAATRRQ